MFKQSRFFFSATMIAILFVSTLILSKTVSAKSRCPIQPPKTLLSLYLDSQSVVIADIKSESITKSEDGDENGSYADVERKLDVIKSFKGQKLPEISFTKSEYIPAVKTDETADNIRVFYAGADYDGFNPKELTVGKRYLFFFSKDEESGAFYQIDYRSSAREITSDNADIYEKRLSELGKIIADKKNQMSNLAEWLVRLTEDEETRWDGASALSRSFGSLEYEQENEEGDTELQEIKTVSDEGFGEYSAAIARQVTNEQKERLSSTFINSLNHSLLGGEKNAEYNYALAELVGNWESARFAMYGFGILQAIDKSDTEKTRRVMNFIADMVDDEQLSTSFYDYAETIREKDVEVTGEPNEISEVSSETAAEPNEIPTNLEKTEQSAEIVGDKTESAETEVSQTETVKLTQEQIREQIFQKFVNRYQELLARNFAPESVPEADIAHTIEESNK